MLLTYQDRTKYFARAVFLFRCAGPCGLPFAETLSAANAKGKVHMKGYTNQNLAKTLPLNESRLSKGEFFKWLRRSAELDPKNFLLGCVEIERDYGPEVYPVIVGEHARKRTHQRTWSSTEQVLEKAINLLRIPMIGQVVVENPVVWNDELGAAVPFEEGGSNGVVVLDERDNLAIVFDCGFSYIRVATIYGYAPKFRLRHGNLVIQISASGAIRPPYRF